MKRRGSSDAQLAGTYITACRRRCFTLHKRVRCFQKERKTEGLESLAKGRCRVHQKARAAAQTKQLLAGKNEETRVWPKERLWRTQRDGNLGLPVWAIDHQRCPSRNRRRPHPLPYIACRVASAGRVSTSRVTREVKAPRPSRRDRNPAFVIRFPNPGPGPGCITSYVC